MDPKVIAAVLCLALAGCSSIGRTTYTGSLCPVGPFIGDPGASERLTRAEKEYIVTLNNSGEKICGWKAPG
jgi:hypothetical protein